jgi:uncharacterized protein (TIGR02145 family)
MRKLILTTAAALAAAGTLWFSGAAEPPKAYEAATFTDKRDSKTYKTAVIGGRTWMAENLNYLPQSGNTWCYENNISNCQKSGRLYDWDAAKTACPAGWRLPSRDDWNDLARAAGGDKRDDVSYGETYIRWSGVGKKLKAAKGWIGGNGTDDYGFSALPGGDRDYNGEDFYNEGAGFWWTSTADTKERYDAYYKGMSSGNNDMYEKIYDKGYGLSVRCIKTESKEQKEQRLRDEARRKKEVEQRIREEAQRKKDEERRRIDCLSTYFTDSRNGRKYRAVEMGGRRWMAENLNYQPKTGNSWCYNDSNSNCGKYGRLYDWKAAKTACPLGWHLPSRTEWAELGQAAGGEKKTFKNGTVDWYGAAEKLKAKSGWKDNCYDDDTCKSVNGTDDFGFSTLPGGNRDGSGARFMGMGDYGNWWTASERGASDAYRHGMGYNNDNGSYSDLSEYFLDKGNALSVRCVQDESKEKEQKKKEEEQRLIEEEQKRIENERRSMEEERIRLEKLSTYFTDPRDGRKYRAVEIGADRWMAENLNYKTGTNWCYDNNKSNCDKYGRLYDWKTARTACPPGWHLPTNDEWDSLALAVGGVRDFPDWQVADKKLKTRSGWSSHRGISGNGTDDYGFSAMPAGSRGFPAGMNSKERSFCGLGLGTYWWTASPWLTDDGWHGVNHRSIRHDINYLSVQLSYRDDGQSVRCVQDASKEREQQRKERAQREKEEEQKKKEAEQRKIEDEQRRKKEAEQRSINEEQKRLKEMSDYFTDSRDGKKYRAVSIGGKKWMAENLNYRTDTSWCYEDDTSYCKNYGRLYDWETAMTVCPPGWYLPSAAEWNSLGRAVGGNRVFDKVKTDSIVRWQGAGGKLISKFNWDKEYKDKLVGRTDDFGFSALPGGGHDPRDKRFRFAGELGCWWTATEKGYDDAVHKTLSYDDYDGDMYENYAAKDHGFSVRCVQYENKEVEQKKKEEERKRKEEVRRRMEEKQRIAEEKRKSIEKITTYFTDPRDGKKYRAVEIGGKRWMAENLNYKTGKSACYEDNNSNCGKYGRLYYWETAKKACPAGWHLPDTTDWNNLVAAVGGKEIAGKMLKSTHGWADGGHGADELGFSGLPAGLGTKGGSFFGASHDAFWWTATKNARDRAYYRRLLDHSDGVGESYDDLGYIFYVRCVANK